MLVEAEGIFKLSDEPGSLGLSCNKEGVVLAGVPLLSRAEAGFAPRPESEIRRLLGEVYGDGFPVEPVISGLGVAAKALNSGDLPRAMIAAVQLKLPSLDWHRAVRMAQADDALSKYSPDHREIGMGDGRREPQAAEPRPMCRMSLYPRTRAVRRRTAPPRTRYLLHLPISRLHCQRTGCNCHPAIASTNSAPCSSGLQTPTVRKSQI